MAHARHRAPDPATFISLVSDATTSPVGSPVVPNIDVGPFFAGSAQGKAQVVAEIAAACEEIGFFSIRNHGVPQPVIDAAWAHTRAFFDHAEAAKMAGTGMTDEYPYGYLPLGSEKLAAGKDLELGKEEDEQPGDLNESFAIGPITTKFGAPAVCWPRATTNAAEFEAVWTAYYQEMERVREPLCVHCAHCAHFLSATCVPDMGRAGVDSSQPVCCRPALWVRTTPASSHT